MDQNEHNSISYALIDGIRRYGETSPVTESDVAEFRRTPESYTHIVRHMKTLSEEARRRACSYTIEDKGEKKQVTPELIDQLLTTAGSKFNAQINDPLTIISFAEQHVQEKVKRREKLLWLKTPRNDYFCYLATYISPAEKSFFQLNEDDDLGTCRVVKITDDIATRITERVRGTGEKTDEILINVVEDTPPPSNTLIIVLHKPDISSPSNVYTAYTGIIAPPLPSDTHTKEEYEYSKEWWSRHTFII